MANELVAVLNKRNRQGIIDASFVIVDTVGVILDTVPATERTDDDPQGDAIYTGNMPAGLPAGTYTWRLQRGNDTALAYDRILWTGTAVVSEAEFHYQQVTRARFDALGVAQGNIVALLNAMTPQLAALLQGQQTIIAEIGALAIPTAQAIATAVEAAIADDTDGTDIRNAIAQAVENALGDDADGEATIAIWRGAVAQALNTAEIATRTNVVNARDAIITALPEPSDATLAKQDDILTAITQGQAQLATLSGQDALRLAVDNLGTDRATASRQVQMLDGLAALAGDVALSAEVQDCIARLAEAKQQLWDHDVVQGPELISYLVRGTADVLRDVDVAGAPSGLPTVTFTTRPPA